MIDADAEHVVSPVAFAAILGRAMVLRLLRLVRPLGLSRYRHGVLEEISAHAVPQAFAAALPVSARSGPGRTRIKLVRIFILGPVVVFVAPPQRPAARTGSHGTSMARPALRLARFVP